MLEVCLLGTGGMMPMPRRYLTSMLVRYNGLSILTDCGEGTQIAMRQAGYSPNPVGIMCFTHYHADHISGLPGMLLSMGNSERTEPLLMIGPRGLERVVGALRVIAPDGLTKINCLCADLVGNQDMVHFPVVPKILMLLQIISEIRKNIMPTKNLLMNINNC